MGKTREEWIEDFQGKYLKICCCGGTGFVRTNAPVGHPLFGVAIPCICQTSAVARQRAERLRKQSGISLDQLQQWSFDQFDPNLSKARRGVSRETTIAQMREIKQRCVDYAADPHSWLVLSGDTGVGKSHLAYAIAITTLHRGETVYVATVADMLDMLRHTFANDLFDAWFAELRGMRLVVLDDFGAQRETDWAMETLFRLLDHRHSNRLPMVITTNEPLNSECRLDGRLRSRLLDASNQLITLTCGDFRRRN